MNAEEPNDYLWDRSGPRDAEVERLEALLAPLRHRGAPPTLPVRATRRVSVLAALAAAAAVVLVTTVAWFSWGIMRGGWSVQTIAGIPSLDGQALEDDGLLRRGGRLVTDGISRARITVGRIGRVDVEPHTRVELVNAGGTDHRLSLERGTIHAQISAPPRFINVVTPSAVAVDLGCAYTLHVDDAGGGLLHVTHGWVALAHDGREAFIPQGAVGATRPGVGPGTPRYTDAPAGYAQALDVLDFAEASETTRAAALDFILTQARPRDALTLWHLLARGSDAERARVFDRLAALSPPPRSVTRDAILARDREALMTWWDAFAFDGTRWWQRLKKRR